MEWIKSSERLPNKNEEYITCGKGFDGLVVSTLEWRDNNWWSDVFQQTIRKEKIQYWMPLPKPPIEK